jgi:MFS transporter, FHS family, glucose/mannose:H+ symporter
MLNKKQIRVLVANTKNVQQSEIVTKITAKNCTFTKNKPITLMKNWQIKLSLYLNYFVFAILLNSVGIVIQKSINRYGTDEVSASNLEIAKDMSILVVSFLLGSFLTRLGYKRGMLLGLAIAFCGCLAMYFGNTFNSALLLFGLTGIAFALIKLSVYSLIGLVTDSSKAHNSLMSSVEGVFMIGIALAYFLFPAFYSDTDPDAWLRVYLLLAGMVSVSFGLLLITPLDESEMKSSNNLGEDFVGMFRLIGLPMVIAFIFCAFLFVMTEQGIMSWLPTFNQKILKLSETMSVQMAAILAISLAVGRLLAGQITKRVSWLVLLTVCIVVAMIIVVTVLPQTLSLQTQTVASMTDIPLIAFVFPLIGLFIAPIYPLINSVVLSALPKQKHAAMTGLLTVFSALGGTIGSRVIGVLFRNVGGAKAFYFLLIPMGLLLMALFVFNKLTKTTDK